VKKLLGKMINLSQSQNVRRYRTVAAIA